MTALALLAAVLAPQVAQVEPVVEFELGGEDRGLEEAFGYVSDVAVDDDGNVYVLDQRADRVRVFSRAGRYLNTFGQRGNAAGELNRPTYVDVHGDELTVLNPSALANTYTLAGQLLASERMPFGAQAATRMGEGRYAVLVEGSISREDPAPVLSVLLGGMSTGVDPVLAVASSDLLFRGPTLTAQIGTSLCPLAHVAIDSDSSVWVASGVDGMLIEWRTEGPSRTPGRSLRVAPPATPLPDSVRALVHAQLPRQIDPTSEDLYTPSMMSHVCGLEWAGDGTLWVRLDDVDGRELWRAIDTEAMSTVRELTAPEGVRLSAFSGDRAYGVRVDAGVMRVPVYRIE